MSFQIKYAYDLVDNLSPSLKKIQSSLKKTAGSVKKTANSFKSSGASMQSSVVGVRSATSSLMATAKRLLVTYVGFEALRKTINTLSDFETSISKVRAVSKASINEMRGLRKEARELGAVTQFTAGQVADGMAFLGMAGFTSNQILKSTADVLDIAAAGQLGLGVAADISSNILTGFNLKAGEMVRIADAMAITAASANTNMFQLGDAMKFVAPVAAGAGMSLETAAAAIGVLSDSGLQGTMAGTGLRRIISELASPTKAAQKEIMKLGLTFNDINPQTNSLVKILEKLKPLAKDTGASFRVFGDRGAPAFQVLSNGIPKVVSLTKKMKEGTGAAKEMAKTMRDNLGGDIKTLFSSIESVTLSIGEAGLTDSLRSATQGLASFFRALSGNNEAYDRLSNLSKLLVTILKTIGSILSISAGGINTGINFIGSGVDKLMSGFSDDKGISSLWSNRESPQINQNQSTSGGGTIDVNFNNLPKGTNTNFTPIPKNSFDVGINSIYSGM